MATKQLSILLLAKNMASGPIGTVTKDLGKLNKVGQIVGKGMGSAWQNTQKMMLGAVGAAVGAGVAAVKWAGDFEAQLRTINTIARETPEGLSKIGDSIRAIARDTGTPLEELTQGYYDLLSAGVKAADAPRVLAEANKLAIGGLSTAAEGVDLLTTAINVYGGDASKAGQFTDEFAKAVERGKVTVAEISASYAGAAPLAASLGIENKELAAGYARLTAAGTPAGEAATQMASAMTALLKKTPEMAKLEKATKKDYTAIAGKEGLAEAFSQARTDAEKYGVELIDLVGRKEALLYILQTTGPNMKAYNADLAAMGNAAGTAAEQMAERQQGLNFQLARMKALVKDAGITIGTKLLPKLTPLIEQFAAFIALDTTQSKIADFGDDLAGGLEDAAKFVAGVDWKSVGDGLKIGATGAKLMVDAFLSAPPWLQGFLATGFVANKFTGGMIGSLVGELGKGLIKGVLGINAGVVNVTGGVVNGGGGTGAAAGGGGLGRLLRVAVIGAVVVEGFNLWAQSLTDAVNRNNALAGAGLTPKEIEAQKFFTGDAAFQQAQFKHTGRTPSQADFESGNVKLGGPQRQPFRSLSPGIRRPGEDGATQLARAVVTEQAAIAKFTASTAPSTQSMEAHLANLKALQISTPARDTTNTNAIVAAISRLGTLMTPVVNVNITANAVSKAQRQTYRVGGSSRVFVD